MNSYRFPRKTAPNNIISSLSTDLPRVTQIRIQGAKVSPQLWGWTKQKTSHDLLKMEWVSRRIRAYENQHRSTARRTDSFRIRWLTGNTHFTVWNDRYAGKDRLLTTCEFQNNFDACKRFQYQVTVLTVVGKKGLKYTLSKSLSKSKPSYSQNVSGSKSSSIPFLCVWNNLSTQFTVTSRQYLTVQDRIPEYLSQLISFR